MSKENVSVVGVGVKADLYPLKIHEHNAASEIRVTKEDTQSR